MHLHSPVLALSPDSLANLGDLDGDSLSELWGVFTKCKDSLQNGRRLENLSWRLWFDSGRRAHEAAIAAHQQQHQRSRSSSRGTLNLDTVTEQDWSDPEGEWTEDSESDDGDNVSITEHHQQQSMAVPTRPSLQSAKRPSTGSNNNQATCSTASTSSRPVLLKDWRSSSTISGGSIQRILTSAPIELLPKAQSVANVDHTHQPLLSPSHAVGLTSRHSSAPEHFDAPLAATPTPALVSEPRELPPSILPPSPRKWVDARTQTTPSNSHRPSPKIPPTPLAMSPTPPTQATIQDLSPAVAQISSSTSGNAFASTSKVMVRTSSNTSSTQFSLPRRTGKAGARRHSSPKPPPPTPATSVPVAQPAANGHSASGTFTSPTLNPSFEARSYIKGFDTSVFESRPQNGSIAPPPTPAVALSSLPVCSPPQRRAGSVIAPSSSLSRSALKSPSLTASTSAANCAPPPKPKSMHAPPSKKIFFISSPNSDSEDDASSSRSRGASIGQYLSDGQRRSSSLSAEVKAPENNPLARSTQGDVNSEAVKAAADQDEEWSDDDEEDEGSDDDGSSSGWGSEYSTSSSARARIKERRREDDKGTGNAALFVKRPSELALNKTTSELKPRPPGLLSQLFHPDLFLEDADRRHSHVDVTRANGASLRAPGAAGGSGLTTSKSTGVLSEQMRSKSFLRGRPEGVELESSSDEGEDEHGNATAEDSSARNRSGAVAAVLSRHQERLRLEALQPIAPPQTPRTTRRAMLATELSESLRRNLLWERQTRNRVLGGAPVNRYAAAAAQPAKPQQQQQQQAQAQAFPNATLPAVPQPPAVMTGARIQSDTGLADAVARQAHQIGTTAAGPLRSQRSPLLDSGVQAPHPSPATTLGSRISQATSNGEAAAGVAPAAAATKPTGGPASGEMVRRHTTGTGLYLAAQRGKLSKHHHRPGSDNSDSEEDDSSLTSSSSESSDDDDGKPSNRAKLKPAGRGVGGEMGGAAAAAGGAGPIRRVKSGVRKKDIFGDPWGQRVW